MDDSVTPESDELNNDPARHTIDRIETIANLDLDKLMSDTIDLNPQTMVLMDSLVSLSARLACMTRVMSTTVIILTDRYPWLVVMPPVVCFRSLRP